MSQSINWDLLEDQYLSDGVYREKLHKMVTIVDEAFLAGKKFARTYSQNMEKSVKSEPTRTIAKNEKNVDVTYREPNNAKDPDVVDITKNIVLNDKAPSCDIKNDCDQLASVKQELEKLLNENKINRELYEKLMSNEEFQLDSQDIADINKLTEDRVKELLLKFKVGKYKRKDNNIFTFKHQY
jgi:predicted HNH restriction endonuclease